MGKDEAPGESGQSGASFPWLPWLPWPNPNEAQRIGTRRALPDGLVRGIFGEGCMQLLPSSRSFLVLCRCFGWRIVFGAFMVSTR
jgi:hypothetical protein